jgi:hypothetical protein
MIANRVLNIVLGLSAWIVVPVQLVTTLVLGILVSLSFGLLLLPMSLIWAVLVGPLISASWVCHKIKVLRNPIGVLGIPLAVVADTYVSLMPSMGELESRASKLMLAESWPVCWEYWQFSTGRLAILSNEAEVLRTVLDNVTSRNVLMKRTLDRLSRGEELDSHFAMSRV